MEADPTSSTTCPQCGEVVAVAGLPLPTVQSPGMSSGTLVDRASGRPARLSQVAPYLLVLIMFLVGSAAWDGYRLSIVFAVASHQDALDPFIRAELTMLAVQAIGGGFLVWGLVGYVRSLWHNDERTPLGAEAIVKRHNALWTTVAGYAFLRVGAELLMCLAIYVLPR